MEENVKSSLKTICYEISDDAFQSALEEAPKSTEYSKIIKFISDELRSLCSIDEEINIITTPEDSVSFLMEISSFLKELACPYQSLSQGPLSDRLKSHEDKVLLLDYLISELMTARILQESKPDKRIELKLQESPEAHSLVKILETLQLSKPTENLAVKDLFDSLNLRTETVVLERGKELISSPLWNYRFSEQQWNELNEVQADLHHEYTLRRKMMLQRLDCTIQSFTWSDRLKDKGDVIMKTYEDNRRLLKVEPDVDVASLLAARHDLAIIEKTSNSEVRKNTRSKVNRVMIGEVPDRGGRTSEQAPPPPEMPSWQQRQAGPSRGRGGGGGGRGRGDNQHRGGGERGGGERGSGGYQRGGGQHGGGHHSYQKQQSYDSAGSYTNHYQHNQPSYGNQQQQQHRSDDQYNYQNEPKRPKTYDSFQNQNERTTYADQYVQESQYNQQHQSRGGRGGGGRGRSNYNRGGRGNYY